MKNIVIMLGLLLGLACSKVYAGEDPSDSAFTMIVMDPMAGPISCDCVQGYAQRKYEKLGFFLSKGLGRKVNVIWSESLKTALDESRGKADIIIGKHSVVLADASSIEFEVRPLAQLTDLNDSVHQTGLFVVRANDPAQSVADLKGYRILFGPAECQEKSAAMLHLLQDNAIPVPNPLETAPTCGSAAVTLMALPADVKAAAVISSYAVPLLEGCKKVKKGDLRVVGQSKPVPFISLFVSKQMRDETVQQLSTTLDQVGLDAKMLIDLETASGFVMWKESQPDQPSAIPEKPFQTKAVEASKVP